MKWLVINCGSPSTKRATVDCYEAKNGKCFTDELLAVYLNSVPTQSVIGKSAIRAMSDGHDLGNNLVFLVNYLCQKYSHLLPSVEQCFKTAAILMSEGFDEELFDKWARAQSTLDWNNFI